MTPYNDPNDPTPHQSVREQIADGCLLVAFFAALAIAAIAVAAIFLHMPR